MGFIADNFRSGLAGDAQRAGDGMLPAVPGKAPIPRGASGGINERALEAAAVVFRGHMHKRCNAVLLFRQLKPNEQKLALADMRAAIRAYFKVVARDGRGTDV